MTKTKICGLTNLTDSLVAAEAGADLLGFIFYEASPRYVAPPTVKEIVSKIKQLAHPPSCVGVFVNSSAEAVAQTLDFCALDLAQLHGEESPEFVNQFQRRAYKAIRPQSLAEAEMLCTQYLKTSEVSKTSEVWPAILLDAYHPHLYGGTGQVTDWTMAARMARRYPIMLAGSLTPNNIGEAVGRVQPWGVDVSSGVEATKGKKDHQKIKLFVEACRNFLPYKNHL